VYPAPPGGPYSCNFGSPVPGDVPFTCNNKLIGAYRFMATYDLFNTLLPGEFPSARDDNGHGTHTTATAAGNGNVAANILGTDLGVISGLAPRAHILTYKICGDIGCYSSDAVAAIEQAISDGVDVINFAMSGGSNPYSDIVELAFLRAYEEGMFVAAGAGNDGPALDTVNHRGPLGNDSGSQ
jgi:subtilisin family serine protease